MQAKEHILEWKEKLRIYFYLWKGYFDLVSPWNDDIFSVTLYGKLKVIIPYHIIMNYSFLSINQIVTIALEVVKGKLFPSGQ